MGCSVLHERKERQEKKEQFMSASEIGWPVWGTAIMQPCCASSGPKSLLEVKAH